MKRMFLLLLVGTISLWSAAQFCGPFDPSFGVGGKALGPFYTPNGWGGSGNILIQPDKKIIELAIFPGTNSNLSDFGLIRYTEAGFLDSSFGVNGTARTGLSWNANSSFSRGVLQSDGKIVVVGQYYPNSHFLLLRFTASGVLDNTFGDGGKVISALGTHEDYAHSVAIQPDGKIVVAGSSADSTGVQAFALARYNVNGSLDSSFAQKGKMVAHVGHFITTIGGKYYGQYSNENATDVKLQKDGKIIVSGASYSYQNCYDYYGYVYCDPVTAILRYTSDGLLDTTFGIHGKIVDSLLMYYPNALDLQADGKIVITGQGQQNGFITERYNADGTADKTFGTSGTGATIVNMGGGQSTANALTVQPDGKLVIGGVIYKGNSSDFVIVRYNADGSSDNTFNGNGIAVFKMGDNVSQDLISGVAISGKQIIAGGYSRSNFSGNSSDLRYVVFALIDNIPTVPVSITANGPTTICQGGSVMLTSDKTGILQWLINGIPIPGETNTTLKANTGGTYQVKVTTGSGCGISNAVQVTIRAAIAKPPILWNTPYFITNSGYAHYQWQVDGTVIPGLDTNIIKPTQIGLYKVTVTDATGCSATSDVFNLVVLAVGDITIGDAQLHYYPNPARTVLHITGTNMRNKKLTAELYDLQGRLVQKLLLDQNDNQMQVQRVAGGVYQLVIYNSKEKSSVKISVFNK